MTLFLSQHRAADGTRSVIVRREGEGAFFVKGASSTRELALRAIEAKQSLAEAIAAAGVGASVDLAAELEAGRLLSPIDHEDLAHVHLTGTGLTHLGSAEGRDKMHKAAASNSLTDSMRMFLEGLEGGKPKDGAEGQQPEWFYKGTGYGLLKPEAAFDSPAFAKDGSEEPELAGIYVICPKGTPFRIGYALANEFSDHITERHNYLWLAHSKLRQASLSPELLVGDAPADLRGTSLIRRNGEVVWQKPFLTGETNMSHSLANLEHHHFKYDIFRQPGDVHVHFYGTATLSFSEGFVTQPGDVFEISAAPFQLPLRNALSVAEAKKVEVKQL